MAALESHRFNAQIAGYPKEPVPQTVSRFLLRYVCLRPWPFGSLLVLGLAAATCAVLVQVAMKMLVDAMATPDRAAPPVWTALAFFISLIAMESILWRASGWLGSRTIV